MIIEIAKIGKAGSSYQGEEPPEIMDLEGEKGLRVEGPLTYDVFASIVSGGVMVRGAVSIRLSLQCVRCAEFFSTTIVESDFFRDYPLREGQQELDITADLREAVILRLPNHPLCGQECRGLCPRCGKNLNDGPCACPSDAPPGAGGWDALDHLRW